tara:strand:- start:5239 stop:6066 length:828 start_codon:yes stop_codon:yes gene_type:complete
MARNTIKVSQIVNDFLLTMGHDDFVNDIDEAVLKNFAKRGVREFGFDIMNRIKSLKLSVNTANDTVELPDDFVDMVKIGVVGTDGIVYVLGENKNINISQKYKTDSNSNPIDSDNDGVFDRVDSKGATASTSNSTARVGDGFEDYVFRNYIYGGVEGRLYGAGGGQYEGGYRVNLDQNRIEMETRNNISEVVVEYIADEARSTDPTVHIYLEEALRAYMYFKVIERKAAVPIAEKGRARQEYYNERRKANARMKAFSKEEALKTIRKNYKQAPKG